MTTETKKIENSSNIDTIQYDGEKQELRVTFKSGSTYEYLRVTPDTFEQFAKAESAGKFFNGTIKGQYHALKL